MSALPPPRSTTVWTTVCTAAAGRCTTACTTTPACTAVLACTAAPVYTTASSLTAPPACTATLVCTTAPVSTTAAALTAVNRNAYVHHNARVHDDDDNDGGDENYVDDNDDDDDDDAPQQPAGAPQRAPQLLRARVHRSACLHHSIRAYRTACVHRNACVHDNARVHHTTPHRTSLVPLEASGPKKKQRIDWADNENRIHFEDHSQIRFLVPPETSGPPAGRGVP